MGEKNEKNSSEKPHPKIIGTEEKKIPYQKPPNNKIIYFNIIEKNSEKEQ
ncbi:MAG: hypothetical protein ACFFDK_06690 [Promethearchaeota archaeon]